MLFRWTFDRRVLGLLACRWVAIPDVIWRVFFAGTDYALKIQLFFPLQCVQTFYACHCYLCQSTLTRKLFCHCWCLFSYWIIRTSPVWPDLEFFGPLDKNLKIVGDIAWLYLILGNILSYFGKFCLLLGNIFIIVNVQILKYNLDICHTDLYLPLHAWMTQN